MYLINNVHAAASGIQLPIPLKPATSSNLFINRLEEAAGFRGIGSWIPEAATCTLLIRYIRENFKIATFSRLSGIVAYLIKTQLDKNMLHHKEFRLVLLPSIVASVVEEKPHSY